MILIVKPSMAFEKTPIYISVSQETKPGLRYMDNVYRMSGFMGGEIASWIDSRINNKRGFFDTAFVYPSDGFGFAYKLEDFDYEKDTTDFNAFNQRTSC